MTMLKFSYGNGKLSKGTAIFNLPAGHSCPFAKSCFSKADRLTGKITDGPDTEFRCYAASLETRPHVRAAHWHNFELVKGKTVSQLTSLIANCLPDAVRYRIHSSGDFFSQAYFDAWLAVARMHPTRIFYAYTKALPYWIKRMDSIPANFILTASWGGKHDYLIESHGLKSARVVPDEETAAEMGLPVDHDDSNAYEHNNDFALVIHGTQPAGSVWAKAWRKILVANNPHLVK